MDAIAFPPPEQILVRIRACRDELAALKKLHRAALAAQQADAARARRAPVAADSGKAVTPCR